MQVRIASWLFLMMLGAVPAQAAQVEADLHGAVGNGTVDDAPALKAVLAAQPAGTIVQLSAGKLYRIASSISVPSGITLDCGIGNPAPVALTSAGGISLDSTATIFVDSGATLQNCIILRRDLKVPAQDSSGFAGTAISLGGGGSYHADTTLRNLTVAGFDKCLDTSGNGANDRFVATNLKGDCNSGWELQRSFDTAILRDLIMHPYVTAEWPKQTLINNRRPGTAFYFANTNDDTKVSNIADYGHAIGLNIEPGRDGGCCSMNFSGTAWLDSNPVALKLDVGTRGPKTGVHFDSVEIVGAGNGVDRVVINGGVAHIGRLEIDADRSTANCLDVNGASLFVDYANIEGCAGQRVSLSHGGMFQSLSGTPTTTGTTLISTQTANNSPDLAWAGLAGADYELRCAGLVPANDADQLVVQIGKGDSPTWQSAGYLASLMGTDSGGTDIKLNGQGGGVAISGKGPKSGISNRDGWGYGAIIELRALSSSSLHKTIAAHSIAYLDGARQVFAGSASGAFSADVAPASAVRLLTASGGAIARGSCSLYAINQ